MSNTAKIENLRLKYSLYIPVAFILTIWIIKIYEYSFGIDLSNYGVYPRRTFGLKGILFSPLIHGDFKHLFSNTVPLFLFLWALFYFHKDNALKILAIIYIATGLNVWIFARYSFHIGASGVVYGLASFHFFSGVLSKRKDFMAISLLLIFLYGGMVWGLFPTEQKISWESHLIGFLIGIIVSVFYYKKIQLTEDKPNPSKNERENFYDFKEPNITEPNLEFYYYQEKKD